MFRSTVYVALGLFFFVSYTKAGSSIEESEKPVHFFTTDKNSESFVYMSGYTIDSNDGQKENTVTESGGTDSSNMDDVTIPVLLILFDNNKYNTNQVRYIIKNHPRTNLDTSECKNFELGTDVVESGIFQEAYSANNLGEKLKKVKHEDLKEIKLKRESHLSSTVITSPGENLSIQIKCCTLRDTTITHKLSAYKNQKLTQQLLAPTRYFAEGDPRNSVCTPINTAPMWDKTKAALQRIHAVVDKISTQIEKLYVIVGTFGKFEYAKPDQITTDRMTCQKEELGALYRNEKIDVPQVIYNVIYQSISTDEGNSDSTIKYGVILVTANGEWTQNKTSYCQTTSCKTINWEKVNHNSQGEKKWETICCKFNDENLEKFKINIEESTRKKPLDLAEVYLNSNSFKKNKLTNISQRLTLPDE